jgi:hypothetical protein
MSMYSYCMFMYLHRASWHSSATLRLRFFRAFSSVLRQRPGYNPQRRGMASTLPKFLCCSMYCLFFVVLCIVCVEMCTVLLPPRGYPIAVNKYITDRFLELRLAMSGNILYWPSGCEMAPRFSHYVLSCWCNLAHWCFAQFTTKPLRTKWQHQHRTLTHRLSDILYAILYALQQNMCYNDQRYCPCNSTCNSQVALPTSTQAWLPLFSRWYTKITFI